METSHYLKTRHADGTTYEVTYKKLGNNQKWNVHICDLNTLLQDWGTFEKQEDGLFGISGLVDEETVGFPMDHISMIQNEIAQDLLKHGELEAPYPENVLQI